MREIFQQPASDKELQGKAGKECLAKLIAEDGDEGGKVNRELDYSESDRLNSNSQLKSPPPNKTQLKCIFFSEPK